MGIGFPFLAKLQLNGGIGYNTHVVTPNVTVDFIKEAFSSISITDAASQDFSQDAVADALIDYMDKNKINTSGFHIQCGAQFKLLILSLMMRFQQHLPDKE